MHFPPRPPFAEMNVCRGIYYSDINFDILRLQLYSLIFALLEIVLILLSMLFLFFSSFSGGMMQQVSYIEIYMEKIRDLLDSYHTKVTDLPYERRGYPFLGRWGPSLGMKRYRNLGISVESQKAPIPKFTDMCPRRVHVWCKILVLPRWFPHRALQMVPWRVE